MMGENYSGGTGECVSYTVVRARTFFLASDVIASSSLCSSSNLTSFELRVVWRLGGRLGPLLETLEVLFLR